MINKEHFTNNYNFYDSDFFVNKISESWLLLFEKLNLNFKNSPIDILELGSAFGSSACWMSDNLLDHKDSTLTCVDAFFGGERNLFLKNLTKSKNYDKVKVIISLIEKFIFQDTNMYNIIYIDADHFKKPTIFYGFFAEQHLKNNGIVIFDDIHVTEVNKGIEFCKGEWNLKEIEINNRQRAFCK